MCIVPARAQATWTDPATRLMWTHQDNGADINWYQANDYCVNLRLGGYAGWRLATIDELAAINDPAQGEINHIKGGIRLLVPQASIWSSSDGFVPGFDSYAFQYSRNQAWNGGIVTFPRDQKPGVGLGVGLRALCVRRP